MKVLVVHPGANTSTADVESGVVYGLRQLGVEVIRYRLDLAIGPATTWLRARWKALRKLKRTLAKPSDHDAFLLAGSGALDMALDQDVDVILIISAMLLHPQVLRRMKRAAKRVVVLFTESPYDMVHERPIAALVDGCWTNERSAVSSFMGVNPRSGYVPHGWHPERHRAGLQKGDEQVHAHDVVFVGTAFEERIAWFEGIDWTNIDLGLYGNWEMLPVDHPLQRHVRGKQISNRTAASLYRRARVALNLYRTTPSGLAMGESLNPRAYELAACGVFAVSEARAESAEVFGDLVPTCHDPRSAEDLIRHWLADDARRCEVQRQLPGAVAHASWSERSKIILGDLQELLGLATAA